MTIKNFSSDMSSPSLLYQGTTPTYAFTLAESVDLSTAESVYLTFAKTNYEVLLTKEDNDLQIEGNTVSVFLEQDDTLSFPKGKVLVQVNWTYDEDGETKRACTDIATIEVKRNLLNDTI